MEVCKRIEMNVIVILIIPVVGVGVGNARHRLPGRHVAVGVEVHRRRRDAADIRQCAAARVRHMRRPDPVIQHPVVAVLAIQEDLVVVPECTDGVRCGGGMYNYGSTTFLIYR